MTKDVFIKINGAQQGMEENAVTIELPGTYHFANGKHFIQYDEPMDQTGKYIRNSIKISKSEVTYSKKDAHHTRMYFEINQTTQMNYHTPYGMLALDVCTSQIDLLEEEERLEVKLIYNLSNNGVPVSDNGLSIIVRASSQER